MHFLCNILLFKTNLIRILRLYIAVKHICTAEVAQLFGIKTFTLHIQLQKECNIKI